MNRKRNKSVFLTAKDCKTPRRFLVFEKSIICGKFCKAIVLRLLKNSPLTRCRGSSPKGRAFLWLKINALISVGANCGLPAL